MSLDYLRMLQSKSDRLSASSKSRNGLAPNAPAPIFRVDLPSVACRMRQERGGRDRPGAWGKVNDGAVGKIGGEGWSWLSDNITQ